MKKITITIDLSKIDKSRIVPRTYTNKEGVEITEKNYSMEVVELLQPTTLKESDTWILQKTHFVTDGPTKPERDAKVKMKTLGNGISITDKVQSSPYPQEETQFVPDDVAF